mmetsp:Transcript_13039/g.16949  ORF Transcript_13039/g.16949 Transcript_13039/m.16949 type:complete len:222 (-) Transcript_13039:87-752(-)
MIINSSLAGDIRVSEFIHTETQDGKGLIDAHFARGKHHCHSFMRTARRNTIREIASARGLAAALAWNGGIQNSCVQFVQLDRKHLVDIKNMMKKAKKELSQYFSRVNHIVFPKPESCHRNVFLSSLSLQENISQATYKFKAFTYSGVTKGATSVIKLPNYAGVEGVNNYEPIEEKESDEESEDESEDESDTHVFAPFTGPFQLYAYNNYSDYSVGFILYLR